MRQPVQTDSKLIHCALLFLVTWGSSLEGLAQTTGEGPSLGGGSCPISSGMDLSGIARAARGWDDLADTVLATPAEGDHVTTFGTLMDRSCFEGISEEQRRRRIQRLEEGLATAFQRIRSCAEDLHFTEISPAISVLRRTRIVCQDLGGGLGQMGMSYPCTSGHVRTSAGYDRHYEMLLAVPGTKAGASPSARSFEDWDLEDLGSVLAHEAMHTLPLNNRDWHNNIGAGHNAKLGCGADSMYRDRVYFTEAACFPNSVSGRMFYGSRGAASCPELCEDTLSGVDDTVRNQLRTASSLTDPAGGIFGPPLLSNPPSATEIAARCTAVRARAHALPATASP